MRSIPQWPRRCDGGEHQLQHQRRCRLGQVQHQQQRGSQLQSSPDFETPASAASSNVYDIVITATEANNTNTVTQSVAITVTDVGDVAPAFTSGSSATYAENATGAVYTAVASPDVAGRSITYSISGADAARFSINSTVVWLALSAARTMNQRPTRAATMFTTLPSAPPRPVTPTPSPKTVAVTVTDVGDVAPVFTSANSISASFAENGTGAVYTAVATPDVTGAAVSYSIGGGLDSARFSIDSSSGVVRFVSSPDFETPADVGTNNIYELVISATEAGNTFVATRSLTVTVTDVVLEGPTFSSASSAAFAENATGAVIPQWRPRRCRVRRCYTASAAGQTRPSSASTAAGWSALSAART